jgi:hypothetical protein
MKTARVSIVLLLLAVLVVAVLAVPVAALATFTAPLHSPELAAELVCPPGSHLDVGTRDTDNGRYGRQVTAPCVDAQGRVVPRRALDESALVDGVLLFYPRVAGLLMAVASVPWMLVTVGLWAWRRKAAERPLSRVRGPG